MGIVNGITFGGSGEPSTIDLFFPNSKQKRRIECKFFCPARVGDIFLGYCNEKKDGTLTLIKQPFVQPDVSNETIIKCIVSVTKMGYGPAKKMLDAICISDDKDQKPHIILNSLSQIWVDTKSEEALDVIANVDRDITKKFLQWWYTNRSLRSLYLLGLTKKEINACRMKLEDIYEQCLVNPYVLPAVPLEKCENILYSRNIRPTKIQDILGSILRVIWNNQHNNSWASTPVNYISKQYTYMEDALKPLTKEYGVTVDDNKYLYINKTLETENWVYNFIKNKVETDNVSDIKLDAVFKRDLSEDQKKAVNAALAHNFCIITGGAGVGKTSCLAEIMENLELKNVQYGVCSFTGKAVSVIREKTKKRTPCTIHKLISNASKYGDYRSVKFEKESMLKKLEHIIIDEASMLTTQLFYDLMYVYPHVKRITLIGDSNQLPPIEWGCIFEEIIKSRTVPTYVLTTNYRTLTPTGEIDGVIKNANKIVKCVGPFHFTAANNFTVTESPIEAVYTIVKSCHEIGIKSTDIQIITPYNVSIPEINHKCQQIFIPSSTDSITDSRGTKWCVGDKVMLTENDSDIGVYNGESGIVDRIDHVLKKIYVDFGSTGVHDFPLEVLSNRKYYNMPVSVGMQVLSDDEGDRNEMRSVKKLAHSYCITIDKSQGSEWPYVIYFIPYFNGSSFINKRRNYTAITRTKTAIWCVVPCANQFMISCTKISKTRFDGLCRKLCSSLPTIVHCIEESPNENSDFHMDNEFGNPYEDLDMPDMDDF